MIYGSLITGIILILTGLLLRITRFDCWLQHAISKRKREN